MYNCMYEIYYLATPPKWCVIATTASFENCLVLYNLVDM